ncbi:S8 family serine peptidase [Dyadobacter sp. CY261]|uniref:S8 family serine peptidase n=1 Tax=Dyadobacter sp. CY261 TaxID=2907203 RepID=UPI001F3FA0CE|nr:S8 family serine peptidase [Dyadobacter sp. CY261]MCF0069466.1 S8 family serine peptidase [Dyadobacter sp. CY261]
MCFSRHRWWLMLLLVWLNVNELIAQDVHAYKLYLKSGTLTPVPNLENAAQNARRLRSAGDREARLVVIQFYEIPGEETVRLLAAGGIALLEYVPDYAYTATVGANLDVDLLRMAKARSVIELEPRHKIQPALLEANAPPHAVKERGKVDVRMGYIKSITFDGLKKRLDSLGVQLLSEGLVSYQLIDVRVPGEKLLVLAGLPWVQYIEAVPPPEVLFNDRSEAGTRANVLTSMLAGQRGLNGDGVVIGIGDTGNLMDHIDVSTKLISSEPQNSYWHGVHVAGIAAGAGIVNEKYRGYAPKALLVKRSNSDIWRQASSLVRDFGMVLASNAYGGSVCPEYGNYSFDSYTLDKQAIDLPNLQQVFAAGNSALIASCGIFMAGFGSVIGGYISAKNVISVGNTGTDGLIAPASSRGPVLDGRIKPEIIAPGSAITSTVPANAYGAASGTSMAAPAVTGGLALLYQRYRQLNNQSNPKNMLMKALICNGATDKGLPGPDFTYGFGLMNLLRSVTMLEKASYFNGRIAHQAHDGYEIMVPSNTALVKIMLYWNDPAPSMLGAKTLVNDLDLKVIRPGNAETLPSFPRPGTPDVAAVEGVDTVNNIEQIVLQSPATGTYLINISGTKVPSGTQEYFLVYDIIETSAVLTHPVGSEKFTKSDVIDITWDSYGNAESTFSVAYSLNDGTSWTTINAAVPAGINRLSWTVPNASTTNAKIRITQNSTGVVKESAGFAIIGVPVITLSANQCESYAAVQWTAVSGATDYEVMRLAGNEMRSVAVTSELKYVLSGLSRDSTYYISVRPRKNGVPGRRALAISRKPDSGTCQGIIPEADLAVDAIISPVNSGRLFTSSVLTQSQVVKVGIKNLYDKPLTQSFQVGYAVGEADAPVHWETVETDIAANGYLEYTFTQTVNMLRTGSYPLTVSVKSQGDPLASNNQKSVLIRQLANDPVNLPFFDDLEVVQGNEIYANKMGIAGTDRYDFSQERDLGRLRTSTGDPVLAYSGTKAFTVDANNWTNSSYPTALDATYNLAAYHSDRDEIRLTFRYRMYATSVQNWPLRVYIRGKDTDQWISALESSSIPYFTRDNNYLLISIDVSNILKQNVKDFSTSFQVRWEQAFRYPAQSDGATIDDIRLFTTTSDMEVASVKVSGMPSCDSNGYQAYSALIKNNSSVDSFRVPFEAHINGAPIYVGFVPVVRAGRDTLVTFDFSSTHDLNIDRNIKVVVKKTFDTNSGNDFSTTIRKGVQGISTFPYLEDFENGAGGWYTSDANPLWAFGTPSNGKVKEAASGKRAWSARAGGASEVVSYLYSPCFAMNGMAQPTLSFSASIDLAICSGGTCDIAYVEYNVSGNTWMRLGAINSGTNWFNSRQENADAWNVQDYTRWHVATVPIPNDFPGGYVRFRFVIKTKAPSGRAGIAIDDIHLYDLQAMVYYSNTTDNTTLSGELFGNQWVPYELYNSMLVAINPNGQTMGQVLVRTYLDNGATRIQNRQYYSGRSYTIKTAQSSYERPIGVRLYMTDEESERLINAPEKSGIAKPGSAYDLAITKYSGDNEDGIISNNGSVVWSYVPSSEVKKVPYAQGYYLEFATKTLSEFWFAKEFVGPGTALPVRLASFLAKADGNTTRLEWLTAEEKNADHFEIERSADALTWGTLPGQIPAANEGRSRYNATDELPTAGVNYYRLKMVDMDRTFAYSQIVSVDFGNQEGASVVLFPNPVTDKLNIRTGNRRLAKVSLYSQSGHEVYSVGANNHSLDVAQLVPGVHWVTIHYADGTQSSHKIVIVH